MQTTAAAFPDGAFRLEGFLVAPVAGCSEDFVLRPCWCVIPGIVLCRALLQKQGLRGQALNPNFGFRM